MNGGEIEKMMDSWMRLGLSFALLPFVFLGKKIGVKKLAKKLTQSFSFLLGLSRKKLNMIY